MATNKTIVAKATNTVETIAPAAPITSNNPYLAAIVEAFSSATISEEHFFVVLKDNFPASFKIDETATRNAYLRLFMAKGLHGADSAYLGKPFDVRRARVDILLDTLKGASARVEPKDKRTEAEESLYSSARASLSKFVDSNEASLFSETELAKRTAEKEKKAADKATEKAKKDAAAKEAEASLVKAVAFTDSDAAVIETRKIAALLNAYEILNPKLESLGENGTKVLAIWQAFQKATLELKTSK